MNTVLKAAGLMTVFAFDLSNGEATLTEKRKCNIWIQFTQPVEYQSTRSVEAESPTAIA